MSGTTALIACLFAAFHCSFWSAARAARSASA